MGPRTDTRPPALRHVSLSIFYLSRLPHLCLCLALPLYLSLSRICVCPVSICGCRRLPIYVEVLYGPSSLRVMWAYLLDAQKKKRLLLFHV